MSRSEEFSAGSGSRFHPNVDHYRDGGMGGIGPEHSVVGMVPTHVLARMREYDRSDASQHPGSREVIDSLRQDLREGKGFHNPAMIEYDHKSGWAYLGEGNHRVQAAVEEGVPEIPARVIRSSSASRMKERGVGVPATHKDPGWSRPNYPYVPSDMHPSFLEFRPSDDAKDTTSEIMDLLRPSWSR
jgi:hypothetical protein